MPNFQSLTSITKMIRHLIANIQPLLHKDRLMLIILAVYLLLSFFTASDFLYSWDAGQLALGTERFSLSEHQPHPPGYFLFIQTSKIFNLAFADINQAFILINILVGGLALIFLYRLIEKLTKNQRVAAAGTILFAVNPVFWFYHSIALTYTFEAFIASFLAFATYLAISEKKQLLPLSILVVAITAGFRPSVIIIALPFFVIQFIYSTNKLKVLSKSIATGIIGSIIWFPFFIQAAGGLSELYNFISAQAAVAKQTSVYNINHHTFLFLSIFYALHLPLILIAVSARKTWQFIKEKKLYFLLIAFVWQILVYMILHFGEVGYILAIVPLLYPLLIPLLKPMDQLKRGIALMIVLVVIESWIFLGGMPLIDHHKTEQLTFADIQQHDNRITTYLDFVKQYNPENTLIIMLRGQYLEPDKQIASYPYDDIRLLSYYLPEYKLYDHLGVPNIYFTAQNFQYTQHQGHQVDVPEGVDTVIFLADYIHPEMRPENLELTSKFNNPNAANIYWGEFEGDEFEYNGMEFKK